MQFGVYKNSGGQFRWRLKEDDGGHIVVARGHAAVPEIGHALVGPLGAPKGRISTFAETQLKDAAGKLHIPDGAIVGKTSWEMPS
jgi:hypothetical protein